MNCNDVQQLLSEYLDGELPVEQQNAVRSHLAQCNACSAELKKYHTLRTRAASLPKEIAPPTHVWASIEQRIGTESIPQPGSIIHRESKAFWRNRLFAIAAMVLIVVGAFWIASRTTTQSWNVASIEGTITVGSAQVETEGKLRVGELLRNLLRDESR